VTRKLQYWSVVGVALMAVLLFFLTFASGNSSYFEDNYSWLLGMNVVVAAVLLVLVILLMVRLYRRYRLGRFGSKLMVRLVLFFSLIGVIPGALIYMVSVQFVSNSIESWFNVKVESALSSGVDLGRAALDDGLNELVRKAKRIAAEVRVENNKLVSGEVDIVRERSSINEAIVVGGNGQVIFKLSQNEVQVDVPTVAMLNQVRKKGDFSEIENSHVNLGREDKGGAKNILRLRVIVPLVSNSSEHYFLQMQQMVPSYLSENAETLRVAYSQYQQRALARSGLRKIYLITLTLTWLLAILGAIVSALLVSGNLVRPLLLLAEGTRAVAEGNLSPRPILHTNDELGVLTKSFHIMTRQLFEARNSAENNRVALENAKSYLESVLENMSAGVIVLDSDFKLVSYNTSVTRILLQDLSTYLGQSLNQVEGVSEFMAAVVRAFSLQRAQVGLDDDPATKLYWQQQIEISHGFLHPDKEHVITVLARGSNLPLDSGNGYVVVFDDISGVISVQRSLAWGEVACRLAHEIKNPLTPIQLSAERLQMKLEGKLSPEDAVILAKGTTTIVNQVASMQRMVDDFRDYAKTSTVKLAVLDLNALIEEILHLYLNQDGSDIIHAELAADLPEIMGDAVQLRQVIHNLLQNAQDAVMERFANAAGEAYTPQIEVTTEKIEYQTGEGEIKDAIRLSIRDNGPGFSQKMLACAFEPYMTSKVRGTGLGLPTVKKIVEEHGGRIDIVNRAEGKGAKILILLHKLAEEKGNLLLS
jgi:nitrogen fixation/metabolism regulation signal transduction histidine kinase